MVISQHNSSLPGLEHSYSVISCPIAHARASLTKLIFLIFHQLSRLSQGWVFHWRRNSLAGRWVFGMKGLRRNHRWNLRSHFLALETRRWRCPVFTPRPPVQRVVGHSETLRGYINRRLGSEVFLFKTGSRGLEPSLTLIWDPTFISFLS